MNITSNREIKYQLALNNKVIDVDRIEWRKGKPYRAGYNDKELGTTKWFYLNNDLGYTLREFTGAIDTHGKDVYEGDILKISARDRYDPKQGTVIWNGKTFKFELVCRNPFYKDRIVTRSLFRGNAEYDIIGNIYENSELHNKVRG